MAIPTQRGVTIPVPGQEKEEPDLWHEDDIPTDEGGKGKASESTQDRPERGERDD